MSTLAGRHALVTGAGTDGMGRAIARALAREGADLAIHYFGPPDGAEALAGEVRDLGRNALTIEGDFATAETARATVRRALDGLGGLDILICCAATMRRAPLLEISDAEWDRVHAVNLRGTFACAQEAARHMVAAGVGGRIVIVSSVNQWTITRGLVHYAATKGGLMQLAKGMALELAPHGVTVNLIAPGTIETDFNRTALADPPFRAAKEALIPMGRIGTPADVAGAAVFLVGPGAAYVTGATITIDGGLVLE